MGIALDVGEGVVLAVHGHPLPGPDAGGDPDEEPEHLGDRPTQASAPGGTACGAGRPWWRRWRAGSRRRRRAGRGGSCAASDRSASRTTYWSVGEPGRLGVGRGRRTPDRGGRRQRPVVAQHPRGDPRRGRGLLRRPPATRARRSTTSPPASASAGPACSTTSRPRRRSTARCSSASCRTGSPASTLAIAADAQGWEKVELVLRAGFDYFADNPDYVRLVRREAIDGGVHLGIDLAAVLRPMFELRRRVLRAGDGRRHVPPAGRPAAADHRLRRPAQLLLRRPVPRRAARDRPARPAGAAPSARTTSWRSSAPPSSRSYRARAYHGALHALVMSASCRRRDDRHVRRSSEGTDDGPASGIRRGDDGRCSRPGARGPGDRASELFAALEEVAVTDRRRQRALDRWFGGLAGRVRSYHDLVDAMVVPALAGRGALDQRSLDTLAADHAWVDQLLGDLGDALGVLSFGLGAEAWWLGQGHGPRGRPRPRPARPADA